MALAALGVSGFFSRRNIEALHVEWRLPERIFAGEVFPAWLKVSNRRFYPRFALWVKAGVKRKFLPYVRARGEEEVLLELSFQSRGWQKLPALEISSSFPAGFIERRVKLPSSRKALVYPRIFQVYPHFPEIIIGEGAGPVVAREGDEFSHLREVEEADVRRINWKVTARIDRPVEVVRGRTAGREVVVVLDCYVKENFHRFEENICLLASLGFYFMERSMPHLVVFKGFSGEVGEENLDDFLTGLALLKPCSKKEAEEMASELSSTLTAVPFLMVNEEDSPFLQFPEKFRLVAVKR